MLKKTEVYTLKSDWLEVHVSTWGATITRMIVPDKDGCPVDVLLGMERGEDYMTSEYIASGAYLGACIGRYANRIAGGTFVLDGVRYQLAVNNGTNHLHGGVCGFDKKIWDVIAYDGQMLTLGYCSPDGEEGYPGTLNVRITFAVVGRELKVNYHATTDKSCYVSLTHHPYFNLNPVGKDIRSHLLKLNTSQFLKSNDLIPDGTLATVEGDYDFTTPKPLGDVIEHRGGLDDCFVFNQVGVIKRMAELESADTGIKMYVCSDYPGLQVYTGRYLNVYGAKGGRNYGPYAGVALEAQYFPDSPNHQEFPSTLLKPGEEYSKNIVFGFE